MSEPPSPPPPSPPRPFWPTREEARNLGWGLTLVPLLLLIGTLPVLLGLGLLWLIPEGDRWALVGLRLGVLLGTWLLFRWWIDRAIEWARRVYATRLSPAALRIFDDPPPPPARSVAATLRGDWPMLVGIGIGLALAFGALHGDSPLLDLDGAPRKLRGLATAIAWCRGHEHTTRTIGVLMALIGLAGVAHHARQAWRTTGRWFGPVPAGGSRPDV